MLDKCQNESWQALTPSLTKLQTLNFNFHCISAPNHPGKDSDRVCDEKPFSILETRTGFAFFWSRASRREQEFLFFNLVLWDGNKNFFLSISCFDNSFFQSQASRRERVILIFNLRLQEENENRDYDKSCENFWEMNIVLGVSMTNNVKLCKQVNKTLRMSVSVIFSRGTWWVLCKKAKSFKNFKNTDLQSFW